MIPLSGVKAFFHSVGLCRLPSELLQKITTRIDEEVLRNLLADNPQTGMEHVLEDSYTEVHNSENFLDNRKTEIDDPKNFLENCETEIDVSENLLDNR